MASNQQPLNSPSSASSTSPNNARPGVSYPPASSYAHSAFAPSVDPYSPITPLQPAFSTIPFAQSQLGPYGGGSYAKNSPGGENASGSDGQGEGSTGAQTDTPATGSAEEKKALVLKSRSTVACVLCRKQKMKCEGPDKAPCRRCRVAGVECTFESAPHSAPRARGSGVSEPWVEQRLYPIEERLSTLEQVSAPNVVGSQRHALADHERRIAQLEAQLYALQFGPPPPQHFQAMNAAGGFGYPPTGPPRPPFPGGGGGYSPAGRFGAEHVKREGSMGLQGADEKRRAIGGPDDTRPDFLERGEVTEEQALMCFESYFLNFAAQPPPPSSQTCSSSVRPIHLDFNETRQESPLLLATIVFIGARALNHAPTCHAALAEAIRLCHITFLPNEEAGEGPTETDLKGIILLGLYNGFPDLMAHGVALAYKFGLPSALLRYDTLSEDEKRSREGRELINKGRTFIVSYLFTAFYSFSRGEHGAYAVPKEVVSRQLEILEGSDASQQPTDRVLRVQCEECFILFDVYKQLGQGMRLQDATFDETCDVVAEGIVKLQNWLKEWVDMMELVTQWGDTSELKTSVPFHHGRMSLLTWVFRHVPEDSEAHRSGRLREFAKMARESAITILRFGVESRIWLPHSMVALYLHHVNIPSALNILYTTSRLYPGDTSFPVVRSLLHRILKQCDSQLYAASGSAREQARAQKTKDFVLDFDRYAFEATGLESEQNDVTDDPLFGGDDVSASLGALRGELNLWGIILSQEQD